MDWFNVDFCFEKMETYFDKFWSFSLFVFFLTNGTEDSQNVYGRSKEVYTYIND